MCWPATGIRASACAAARYDHLRLPCFWFGDEGGDHAVGVLPAFGSFTGMHPIERRDGDRIFAVADGVVRALPAVAGGLIRPRPARPSPPRR